MTRDNVRSLTTIPANDGNFIAALKYATGDELNRALMILKEQQVKGFKHKSRITACEREVRKRMRNESCAAVYENPELMEGK